MPVSHDLGRIGADIDDHRKDLDAAMIGRRKPIDERPKKMKKI